MIFANWPFRKGNSKSVVPPERYPFENPMCENLFDDDILLVDDNYLQDATNTTGQNRCTTFTPGGR